MRQTLKSLKNLLTVRYAALAHPTQILTQDGWLMILLIWGSILLFGRNGALALWEQDEAAYAGFALRMVQTGDWLIPEFTGAAIHQKPPLHFWAIATVYQQFGVSEFTTRLPGSLAILVMGAMIMLLGRGLWSWQTRAIAAIVCWSSLLLPVYAKIALTDGLLVCWSTLALLCWLQALRQPRWFWHLGIWVAVGLGLLTKGPPLFALVLGSEVVLALTHVWGARSAEFRDRIPNLQLRRMASNPQNPSSVGIAHPIVTARGVTSGMRLSLLSIVQRWLFAPLAVVPLGVWVWRTVERDGGDYIRTFLDFYLFQRLAGATFAGQTGPPGYYTGILAIAFLPWLPWFCCALVQLWRERRTHPELWAWLIAGWLGYELIPSKLPSYMLGAYPLLAILIAQQVQSPGNSNVWRWGVRSFGGLSVLLTVGLGGVAVWLNSVPLGVTAGVWFTGSAVLCWRWRKRAASGAANPSTRPGFRQTTAQSLLLLSLIWFWVLPSWQVQHSAPKRLVEEAIAHLKPHQTLTLVGQPALLSLPFYLEAHGQSYGIIADIHALPCYEPENQTLLVLPAIADILHVAPQAEVTGWFGQFGTATTYWLIESQDWCAAR